MVVKLKCDDHVRGILAHVGQTSGNEKIFITTIWNFFWVVVEGPPLAMTNISGSRDAWSPNPSSFGTGSRQGRGVCRL